MADLTRKTCRRKAEELLKAIEGNEGNMGASTANTYATAALAYATMALDRDRQP